MVIKSRRMKRGTCSLLGAIRDEHKILVLSLSRSDGRYRHGVKWKDPATRHADTWGKRRYSSRSFLTLALCGCERSASRPGRALLTGKGLTAPIVRGAGWAPEPVWTQRLEEKSLASVGDRNPGHSVLVRQHDTAKSLFTCQQYVRSSNLVCSLCPMN
jgi:hypothetical protein